MKGFNTLQQQKEEKIREEKQAQQMEEDLKIIGEDTGKTTIIYEESGFGNAMHTVLQIIIFLAVIAALAALYFFVVKKYI